MRAISLVSRIRASFLYLSARTACGMSIKSLIGITGLFPVVLTRSLPLVLSPSAYGGNYRDGEGMAFRRDMAPKTGPCTKKAPIDERPGDHFCEAPTRKRIGVSLLPVGTRSEGIGSGSRASSLVPPFRLLTGIG